MHDRNRILSSLLVTCTALLALGCPASSPLATYTAPSWLESRCGGWIELYTTRVDTSRIRGKVTLTDRPIQGVMLLLYSRDKTLLFHVATQTDGSFLFPRLQPGQYWVDACMPGFNVTSQMVTVSPHAPKETIHVRLSRVQP